MKRVIIGLIVLSLLVGSLIWLTYWRRPAPVLPSSSHWPSNFNQSFIYVVSAGANNQLGLYNLDQRQAQPLTSNSDNNFLAAIAADGQQLVFAAQTSEKIFHIRQVDLSAKKLKILSQSEAQPTSLSFSPDSQKLFYNLYNPLTSSAQLFYYDLAKQQTFWLAANAVFATWSADSQKILYSQQVGSGPADYQLWWQEIGPSGRLGAKKYLTAGIKQAWFYQLDLHLICLLAGDKEEIADYDLATNDLKLLTTFNQTEEPTSLHDLKLSTNRQWLSLRTQTGQTGSVWLLHLTAGRLQKLTPEPFQIFWTASEQQFYLLSEQQKLFQVEIDSLKQELIGQLPVSQQIVSDSINNNFLSQPLSQSKPETFALGDFLPAGDKLLLSIAGPVRPEAGEDTLLASQIGSSAQYRLTILSQNYERIYEADQLLLPPEQLLLKALAGQEQPSFYLKFSSTEGHNYWLAWNGERFDLAPERQNE